MRDDPDAFDLWLRRGLALEHQEALREELPAEWLAMLSKPKPL